MKYALLGLGLGLAFAAGCAPSAPSVRAPASDAPAARGGREADLPFASNAGPIPEEAPLVVVDSEHVLLDGAVVGDVDSLASSGRVQRIDGELAVLRARRDVWKAAHPGGRYPGVAILRMPGATTALIAKSVFQTAAFAGHDPLLRRRHGRARRAAAPRLPRGRRPGAWPPARSRG